MRCELRSVNMTERSFGGSCCAPDRVGPQFAHSRLRAHDRDQYDSSLDEEIASAVVLAVFRPDL